jgi:signal transduction histidine kinase
MPTIVIIADVQPTNSQHR